MLQSILIPFLILFCAGSFPAITFAMPVHYTASGSLMDTGNQLLQVTGWVNIDDQIHIWGMPEGSVVTDDTDLSAKSGYFSITEYSFRVGDYAFSGSQGLLSIGSFSAGDRDAFFDGGAGAWESWYWQYFHFNNGIYWQLADTIELQALGLDNDPILPYETPGSLWLTRQVSDPVPEPSSILLFGVGLVGLAAYSRKRMKK